MSKELEQKIQELLQQGGQLHGVGCDLVSLERITQLLEKRGERFPQRILSEEEFVVWSSKKPIEQAKYLAKRWAGKEAVVKAAGSGFVKGTSWREISILNDENGKPFVLIKGDTAETFKFENGKRDFYISLSDDAGMALAFCVAVNVDTPFR